MAKQPSKSKRIRDYIVAHPDAGPTEVSEALSKYKIAPSFVSNVKNKMNGGAATGRRRKITSAAGMQLVEAAKLIRLCGGIKEASAAIVAAAEISDVLGAKRSS